MNLDGFTVGDVDERDKLRWWDKPADGLRPHCAFLNVDQAVGMVGRVRDAAFVVDEFVSECAPAFPSGEPPVQDDQRPGRPPWNPQSSDPVEVGELKRDPRPPAEFRPRVPALLHPDRMAGACDALGVS